MLLSLRQLMPEKAIAHSTSTASLPDHVSAHRLPPRQNWES
ncbi:MAG: hypothetical protein AAFY54_06135 [Cyanobacteria bacterium J06648_10]